MRERKQRGDVGEGGAATTTTKIQTGRGSEAGRKRKGRTRFAGERKRLLFFFYCFFGEML